MSVNSVEAYLKLYKIKYEPEYRFHPSRKWRFDYAIPSKMIAFEYEGAIYSNGRHTRGKGYALDCEKYNEAQRLGWKVYRFTIGMDFEKILEYAEVK